ncbi:TolB family protein [Kitasatospora mediocidica]|uniref:TolB family protein n=1 Tax=Kitasatospora mediocidica TaxID=58352 RepID=UPI00055B979D|nr:PD40 domain-containing protein [Kitasatospora mediocidica]
MSARTRSRSTLVAVALIAAVTGSALLTGCGPDTPGTAVAAPGAGSPGQSSGPGNVASAAPISAGGSSAAPTGGARPGASAKPTGSARPTSPTSPAGPSGTVAAPSLNGTAHTGLTISNGTNFVVMNGTSVDFGTVVRDLAWSPDGSRAAFIDGSGNLDTSKPDGTGRVTVAVAPSGESWSHPTWQVTASGDANGVPPKNNILFAASKGGVSRLEGVLATAVHGTPAELSLNIEGGEDLPANPTTGNAWPNVGGKVGSAVYANSANGDVYIRDDYLRQQGGVYQQGSEPALSPDQLTIAFVRSVDGHDHLFAGNGVPGQPAKDLTPAATTDYSEPAFSPDGKTIAVRTPQGVATLPVNGSAVPKLISTVAGLPAYRG